MAQALHPTILEMFIDRETCEAYRLGDIPLGYGYFAEGPDPTMFAVDGLNRVLVDADGEEVKDSPIAAMYYAIANFQKKNYGIPVGSLVVHISADCQQRSLLDGSMVLFPDSCSVPFTKRLTPVAYDGFERAVFYDVSPLYGRILLEQGTRLMRKEVVIVGVNSKQSILTTTTQKGHATRRRRKEAALRHYQFQCSNSVTRPTPSVVAWG